MISIITPVFNAERFLYKTANCILKQTYWNFQWILINDGSSDSSGSICNELALKDKRICVIHQKNAGVSAARNKALQIAEGEWVTFLDADDEVLPDWLQLYHNAISNDIDIIFQGAIIRNFNGDFFFNLQEKKISTTMLIELWQNKFHEIGSAWSKMIRTSFIRKHKIEFLVGVSNFEDWIFLTKCLSHTEKVQIIKGCSYIYNHQNSSLTRNNKRRSAEDTYNIVYHWNIELQLLKKKDYDGFNNIIPYISSLAIQTIIEFYRRKDIADSQRIELLMEFRKIDFVINKMSFAQKITNFLWFRNYPLISDFILRFWQLPFLNR